MAPRASPRAPGLRVDLVSQLSFYGAYHTNPWNQLLHFLFVSMLRG